MVIVSRHTRRVNGRTTSVRKHTRSKYHSDTNLTHAEWNKLIQQQEKADNKIEHDLHNQPKMEKWDKPTKPFMKNIRQGLITYQLEWTGHEYLLHNTSDGWVTAKLSKRQVQKFISNEMSTNEFLRLEWR